MWKRGAVLLSLVAAILAAALTFAHPRPPFAAYPADRWLALLYLALFAAAGFLTWRGARRGLMALAGALVLALLALTLWTPAPRRAFFILLWICWLAWKMGDILLTRLRLPRGLSWLESLALGLPLGWGALMVLVLLLGLMGLYSRAVFYTLLVCLSALVGCFTQSHREHREHREKYSPVSPFPFPFSVIAVSLCERARVLAAFVILFIFVAVGSYLWALAPAVRYDALSYHLAAPARYLQAGRMIELPESFQTYSAHYGEMLYTLALGTAGQPLPGMLSFVAGLVLAAQTYLLGKHLAGRRVGALAALMWLSTPVVGMEMATAYTDLFVGVFVTAALILIVYFTAEHADSAKGVVNGSPRSWRTLRWLLVAGIFSGLALGTKYNAFFLLLPFWIVASTAECTESAEKMINQSPRSSRTLRWLLCGFYLLAPALLLSLPWLLRDYLWTGNPLFPNYNQIFRSPEWFIRPFFRLQPTLPVGLRMLAFPWAGVFDSYRYYHEAPGAALGALPLLGMPWFYWRRHRLRTLALAFAAALVMIFAYGGSVRYLLPLFPLVCILAAVNLDALLKPWNSRRTAALLLALLGFYLFSTRLAFTVRWWETPDRYPLRLLIGQQTGDEFVESVVPVVGAFRYLDGRGEFKVFSVGNELRLYTRSAIYGVMMSKEAFEILHGAHTSAELAQALAAADYDYLLIYRPEQDFRPEIYTAPALNDDFLARYARQVYARRGVELYELTGDNGR